MTLCRRWSIIASLVIGCGLGGALAGCPRDPKDITPGGESLRGLRKRYEQLTREFAQLRASYRAAEHTGAPGSAHQAGGKGQKASRPPRREPGQTPREAGGTALARGGAAPTPEKSPAGVFKELSQNLGRAYQLINGAETANGRLGDEQRAELQELLYRTDHRLAEARARLGIERGQREKDG